MSEPLLPLHREYSDKEKLAQVRQQLKSANRRNYELELKRRQLEKENFELKQRIKQDDEEFPNEFQGRDFVSAKAYRKIMKKSQDWEKLYWELWEKHSK